MKEYFEEHHHTHLANADSYQDISWVAISVTENMPKPIGQVCGPISTGGAGNVGENLDRFEYAIQKLIAEGENIFNQMPLEDPLQRIKKKRESESGSYDMKILEDIYLPLFESGHIHKLFFLPDWRSSTGARWEHEQAQRLDITINYLSDEYLPE